MRSPGYCVFLLVIVRKGIARVVGTTRKMCRAVYDKRNERIKKMNNFSAVFYGAQVFPFRFRPHPQVTLSKALQGKVHDKNQQQIKQLQDCLLKSLVGGGDELCVVTRLLHKQTKNQRKLDNPNRHQNNRDERLGSILRNHHMNLSGDAQQTTRPLIFQSNRIWLCWPQSTGSNHLIPKTSWDSRYKWTSLELWVSEKRFISVSNSGRNSVCGISRFNIGLRM